MSLKPFIKAVGGKRKMLPFLRPLYPKNFGTYYEPFVGGGAVLFDLKPNQAIINDVSEELMISYEQVKLNLKDLVDFLLRMHRKNFETNKKTPGEFYYKIRELDRRQDFKSISRLQRAVRFIFINRIGFNGLYRVNSEGFCNTPWGRETKKYEVDVETLTECSLFLNSNKIEIFNKDGIEIIDRAQKGDYLFCDPPYVPVSETSNFTAFSKDGFTMTDQIRLRDAIDRATDRGCFVHYTNADLPVVRDLFKDNKYKKQTVLMPRAINSVGTGRGKVKELLISNF